ncbi:MAG: response regulator [Anaerolineae bacterium]|nr:response regulator [Anaerolineae bacterium]
MTDAQRILLVEDEPDVADMLRLFFTGQGYTFFHALDGIEALNMATRILPHIILMDIMLPDTDGYQLTVKLRWRPRTAHIPIIFLTRLNARDQRLLGLSLGADDFVPKPFDLQELMLRVQNSIARAARDYLTDLRTGLPAAFTARDKLEQARRDPVRSIIEITLEHAIPYRETYGSAAGATVCRAVGTLLLSVVNDKGHADDFISYLDEDNFLIITAHDRAQSIAEQIAAVFNDQVKQHYSEEDRTRGAMRREGQTHPFMQITCRITSGSERIEVS